MSFSSVCHRNLSHLNKSLHCYFLGNHISFPDSWWAGWGDPQVTCLLQIHSGWMHVLIFWFFQSTKKRLNSHTRGFLFRAYFSVRESPNFSFFSFLFFFKKIGWEFPKSNPGFFLLESCFLNLSPSSLLLFFLHLISKKKPGCTFSTLSGNLLS